MLVEWIVFAVSLPYVAFGSVAALRGIDPDWTSRYTGETFRCFDGSGVFTHSVVNDDYCDCADGSDEPGTAACSQGTFFCRNRGYQSRRLPSYFVDDGVCDCCDGSDEMNGHCKDTCYELGEELRQELRNKEESYTAALKEKSKRLEETGDVAEKWKDEMATCLTEIDDQRVRCGALQEKVDALEAEEKKKNAEEEAAAAANETVTTEAADGVEAAHVDADHVEEVSAEAEITAEEDESAEAETMAEDRPTLTMELDPVEHDDDAGEDAATDEAEQHDYPEDYDDDVEYDDREYEAKEVDSEVIQHEEETVEEEEKEEKGFLGRMKDRVASFVSSRKAPKDRSRQPVRPPPRREETELEKLRREHSKEQRELRTLEDKRDNLRAKIERDYGPESKFISLVDQCFQLQQDKYTYEICFFDKASQKEHRNQVNLGRYEGFGELYDWLEFLHGQRCANGKSRSLRVHFVCGEEDGIASVREPDICEYSANFTTPVACSEAELEELKKQVELIGLPLKDEL